MSLTDLAIRLVVCPRCEARPGAGCTTITGQRARHPHSSRTEPLYVGWRQGYGEALVESAEAAERLYASNRDATAGAVATLLRRRL